MALAILGSVPVIGVGVAQVATTGIAGAATTDCTGTGTGQTVTFSSTNIPGLSAQGYAQVSKKAKITTNSGTISCVKGIKPPKAGTVGAITISSKSTLTCGNAASKGDTDPPSPCSPSSDFIVNSAFGYSSSASTLWKEIPSESWTVGATHYTGVFTSSGMGTCPSGEAGFLLSGHITVPAADSGKALNINACLLGDTGTATTGNFLADIGAEIGGDNLITIVTATLDPSNTTLNFA
jgi:hypothetical protein